MTKNISEIFDYGDAVAVDEAVGEMFDPAEIKELTMKKIHTNEIFSAKTRKRLGRGAVAAIAAAACLALCGVAYAAGLFYQSYNWQGEAVGEPRPVETMVPEEQVIELNSQADPKTVHDILDDRAPRELVVIYDACGDNYSQRSEAVASIDELREKLAAENSPLRVPYVIPADYVLTNGDVAYESTGSYTLMSTETRLDGLKVERYSAPAEQDFISYYRLDYENAAGEHIFICTQMNPETAYGFMAVGDTTVEAVRAAGMDEALVQVSGESATLSMLQYLDAPIAYTDPVPVTDKGESDAFTEVYYFLNATGMDADGLLQLLQP